MNSSAFITALPVAAAKYASPTISSVVRYNAVKVAPARRDCATMMAKNDKKLPFPFPQGFTESSEILNGRAAMMGFVLAVVTEVITGEGVIGQVSAMVKDLEGINVFSKFN